MIDKVHQGAAAPAARVLEEYEDEMVEPDIKKLYMRLEALEADRESMRQALLGMRTEKAQLMLLHEIAQQLAKDATPGGAGVGSVPVAHHLRGKQAMRVADRRVMEDKKTAVVRTYSSAALFKVLSGVWRDWEKGASLLHLRPLCHAIAASSTRSYRCSGGGDALLTPDRRPAPPQCCEHRCPDVAAG